MVKIYYIFIIIIKFDNKYIGSYEVIISTYAHITILIIIENEVISTSFSMLISAYIYKCLYTHIVYTIVTVSIKYSDSYVSQIRFV